MTRRRLVGVLGVESKDPLTFHPRMDTLLSIIGLHIATAIDQLSHDTDEAPTARAGSTSAISMPYLTSVRRFSYFHKDDCIFVDGDYLIRNVPARILWRLLKQYRVESRIEFTNRELRMGYLAGLARNQEQSGNSLILLRRRLEQKCPKVRLVQRGRGRFALEVDAAIDSCERGN